MIRTQVQFEDQQIKWLKDMAREKGVSMSQLVRDSINFFRAHEEQDVLKKRALAAVGRFSSGGTDISERHDNYLAGAYETGGDDDKQ